MRRIRYLFQIALRMIRELSTVDLVQTKQVNLSPDETRRLVSDGNSATYTALARQGTCCVNCAILLGTGAILQCCYFFYFVLTRGKGQLVTLILFCFSKSSFHFLTTRMTSGGVSKHPTHCSLPPVMVALTPHVFQLFTSSFIYFFRKCFKLIAMCHD